MEFFNSLSQPRRKRSQASQLPYSSSNNSALSPGQNGSPVSTPTEGGHASTSGSGNASGNSNNPPPTTPSLLHRASTGFLNQLASSFNNGSGQSNGGISQTSSNGSGERSSYRRDLPDSYNSMHNSNTNSSYYGVSSPNSNSRRSSPFSGDMQGQTGQHMSGEDQDGHLMHQHQHQHQHQQSPPLPVLSSMSNESGSVIHVDENGDAIESTSGTHRRHIASLAHTSSPPGSVAASLRIRSNSSHHSLNSVYSAHSYLSSNPESASIVSETGSTTGPMTSPVQSQLNMTHTPSNLQPSISMASVHSGVSRHGTMASPPGSPTVIDTLLHSNNHSTMPPISSSSSFSSASMNQRRPSNTMLGMPPGNSATNLSLSNSARSETTGAVSDKVLLKKVKVFLDDRQKLKARFQSLVNFIDAANNLDQAIFFQDHAEAVFNVVAGTCEAQIQKIKQRNVKPNSFASKDIQILLRSLTVFRRILLYLPDRLRTGWRSDDIGRLLAPLLDHGITCVLG
ncbi:hypothetical protein BDF22DRAFT_158054 [Syncephalis plumigaleata]|nr:hypothetical protein BDF22DRAFT_158054 [Syncephalis plumigaleata]